MKLFQQYFKWLMLVSGVITATTFYAAINPSQALQSNFGDFHLFLSPAIEVVIRSWAVLVTLMGVLLMFGAFVPVHRSLILVIVSISKLAFIGFNFYFIKELFSHQIGAAVIFDLVLVALFLIYLISKPTHR